MSKKLTRKERRLLVALAEMYEQYCQDGHRFMSAGEDAADVLESYGLTNVELDGSVAPENINQFIDGLEKEEK